MQDQRPILYAVGDIHGQDALLSALHGEIVGHHHFRHARAPARIIHLGDHIDRGPDSRAVIDLLMAGVEGFETLSLMGNHEAMLIEALEGGVPGAWERWVVNGGEETIASFGLDPDRADRRVLKDAIGEERLEWLLSLAPFHRAEPYLFVHAGILPGVPLEQQKLRDLIWIRDRFLSSDADHGAVVVHGHTPREEPETRPNRIGIDTGAGFGRGLTGVKLIEGEEPVFFKAEPRR